MYACQRCECCQETFEHNCLNGGFMAAWLTNGSYAQYIVHPASYATRIPYTEEELHSSVAGPLQ
jgi:D-arabinose 1-dehydrogenase-like Zn-dependent alcohol dehydrogenase